MTAKEYMVFWYRLRVMTPGEMWYRFRRNFRARWDKTTRRAEESNQPALASSADAETLLQQFRRRELFPWQSTTPSEIRILFQDRWPEEAVATVQAAEEILDHRFRIFNRTLPFNGQIDWHLDVLTGKQIPLKHWTELPYWQSDTAPGVKYIWELNRLQHFVVLARAYLLTNDEKYAVELTRQWSDWLDSNPPQYGINWASPLEMALRLVSFTWALQMVKNSRSVTPVFYRRLLQSVADHASAIAGNLSLYSSANNHLLGEALGLVYAGCYYPELREAAKWRRLGFSILRDQIPRQVCADGVIREQTTYYQRYVFDFSLLARLAAALTRETRPSSFDDRMEKMAEFILALMDESGDVPDIGDADGGQTLRLNDRPNNPFRALLSAAAFLYDRGDFKSGAGPTGPELFWLFGREALAYYDRLRPQPFKPMLQEFREGGYVILRSGDSCLPQRAVFDFGSLGLDAMSSHGHSDALQFLLNVGGQRVLIDSGTFTYRGAKLWRDYFRSTPAHNTVMVDGQNQSEIVGPFQWGRRAQARLFSCSITSGHTELAARQDGYRHKGIMHLRRVFYDQRNQWRIEDLLQGSGTHRIQIFWHLAPCEADDEGERQIFKFPGFNIILRCHAPIPLKREIISGEGNPIQGWFSPVFAEKRPNPVVCINAMDALPLQITTEISVEES